MELDQNLIDAAIDQISRRWPNAEQAVAAAMYLEGGQILTSVSLDNFNAAANLCAETGAICQAYTMDRQVTASVCVSREAGSGKISVLAPCGICQERLALWGPTVQVAVPGPHTASGWSTRTLLQVNPYYWATQFTDDGHWPSTADHSW
ncbi:cytidine deaminase [Paeniglutamicibacter kerguelensis]|uniref:Cytidine deaminase n=1 Tax=Paeniglutamicibacter kerguelensis TaxID=254788 RepID=A0ABS4XB39_9MICC|nr:cytidine deaminase [Paeniglutamicibacter kerguelensis]MBP2385678.1 cytidine deaminase [Paeniglutamicibacter kerguelensis]